MSRDDKTNRAAERRNDTACPALEGTGGCPAENDLSADSCAECAKADDDL
ncbi:hypothetical protein G7K71_15580 [Desulfofundulus sp. TPOSR]|jgi:hypothetical protein|uniref:Uncharacterized protein n=1 Tax=Desulfofundulus kuznetsovii (strain DSM 6115 / VKM B-1805 / 17) TaxID=760568 RepID=A0AAU8PAN6_DESK7|nr:hypothetical protein [Desulfofundulus sp. TPOSR]AEG15122.1 hypothetical protein Desku_1541 [Desulfofundulus kuznetsovii DSM 6115]NHM28370.1 hypothetical protein [Desulfofundulus sp. TPOSR]